MRATVERHDFPHRGFRDAFSWVKPLVTRLVFPSTPERFIGVSRSSRARRATSRHDGFHADTSRRSRGLRRPGSCGHRARRRRIPSPERPCRPGAPGHQAAPHASPCPDLRHLHPRTADSPAAGDPGRPGTVGRGGRRSARQGRPGVPQPGSAASSGRTSPMPAGSRAPVTHAAPAAGGVPALPPPSSWSPGPRWAGPRDVRRPGCACRWSPTPARCAPWRPRRRASALRRTRQLAGPSSPAPPCSWSRTAPWGPASSVDDGADERRRQALDVLVMATYTAAQGLIATGVARAVRAAHPAQDAGTSRT